MVRNTGFGDTEMDEQLHANTVRQFLEKLDAQVPDSTDLDQVESLMEDIVESGEIASESELMTRHSLGMTDRISGEALVDTSEIFLIGLMLGTALERDAPAGSSEAYQWKDGNFTLPDEVE